MLFLPHICDSQTATYVKIYNMKNYSTIHPLFMSFYSKPLYQDVGRNWKKTSYLYLFLLLAICMIPITFRIYSSVSKYVLNESPKLIKQVPVITITKGHASTDVQMPYIIKDPDGNKAIVIIDTTGKTTSLKGTDAVALLTDTRLIFKKNDAESRIFELDKVDDLVINQSKLYDWIDSLLEYFPFVIYLFLLLVSFLFRLAQGLIYTLIGVYYAKYRKLQLRFAAVMSLTVVSMTPSIILDTAYNYLNVTVPFWWLIDFAVALGYLFFAIRANSSGENEQPTKS